MPLAPSEAQIICKASSAHGTVHRVVKKIILSKLICYKPLLRPENILKVSGSLNGENRPLRQKVTIANLSPAHFDQEYDYFTFEKIRMHDRNQYRFILIYLQQKSAQPNRMEADGFPCYYLFQKGEKVRLIPAVRKLIRILKTEQADLIHAHNRACIVCAVWSALFLPEIKVLAHVHSFNLVRTFKRRLFYRILGWRISCFAGCSESTTAFLRKKLSYLMPRHPDIETLPKLEKWPKKTRECTNSNPSHPVLRQLLVFFVAKKSRRSGADKFTTIPNSINVERFSAPTVERNTVRKEWNLTPGHFVFLGMGRLAKEKGFDFLIRAFKTVHEKHPEARLLIAGEGEERKRLTELIQTLELGSAVCLIGFRTDAVNLLHAADCFVLSSLNEPFGLVVLEAIAALCPVIAADSGGVGEILSSPDFGKLIPKADQPALTLAMQKVIETAPEHLKKQTVTALAAFDRFSHRAAVSVTEALYDTLTATASAS
jgi:glycosyltransferase involved in cell wall biosynthesis